MTPRVVVAAFALLASVVAATEVANAAEPAGLSRPVTWMATGDSYSSGEGIPRSGLQDPCARSDGAYGPLAASLLRSQRKWFITPVSHNACTGGLTGDFYNGDDRDGARNLRDWGYLLSPPSGNRFDVVTMTFGGNDIGFSEVLMGCLDLPTTWAEAGRNWRGEFGCTLSEKEVEARIDRLVAGSTSARGGRPFGPGNRRESLASFYADVATNELTEEGVLVVVGYPRLFEDPSNWPRWRGAMCAGVFSHDAKMLGRIADRFEARLLAAVEEARTRTKRRIEFVPAVAMYDGHSLCGRDTEWLNGLTVGFWDGSLRWKHGFHPNEIGHRVIAEKVANVVGSVTALEPAPRTPVSGSVPSVPQPVPTTPPPVTAGPRFGIGDPFDAYCVVAWPTAPTRTSRYIQMTMSCPGVPQQFTFVNVTYGDPDLPITPSSGRVRVQGRIEDIATSEYGFKVLVVLARDVTLS